VPNVQVVALAEEAIARPELLAAYAARFAADDPVTLVLYAPAAPAAEIAERLERALAGAGIDTDAGPDLVLLAPPSGDDAAQREVAAVMSALLTSSPRPPAAFCELPRFDADALDGLQDLVTRWTSGAAA
jgi:hypothetical protein